jgi:oxygen-independent coproporphyrinogen-3 oxidase
MSDTNTTSPDAPRSAYVHVPFCRHHCGYCNFTVIAGRDDLAESMLAAIQLELSGLDQPCPLDTLYIGGGTPTHLPIDWLTRLVESLRVHLPLQAGSEFTVEANPVDLQPELVEQLVSLGVTRVSLGVQSFQADKLKLLERDHDAVLARRAMQLVQDAGLDLSIDLIFSVPGESLEDWHADLKEATRGQPGHLSSYGLTVEQGTPLLASVRNGELQELDSELQRQMYVLAIDELGSGGWEHYEVSSFARPDARCRHNQTYWDGSSYLAFGPGASRFLDGRRETNHRSVFTYLKRVQSGESPVMESERLSAEDAARERLVFGLRRMQGVESGQFQQQTGFSVEQLMGPLLDHYQELELVSFSQGQLQLTREGILLSDSIWPQLLRT